ncbi:Fic family protein [Lactobacillus sp. ESL0679]|uniref:Fic family protein n=1 Tax=Lactobacillus sp. ESL0679 TaxID=2983209 RepID=UPI0023F9794F|nr:Fic family protein [Lactobacillus sp. ESL0679]MDF7683788.1 Fic family protein [Lactobacillus sp. ESL0679]
MNYQDQLKQITKLKETMDTYRPLSPLEIKRLEKNIRIEHVWSSAAIEGNTLSKNETAAIIDSGIGATIHGKTIKETLEIINLSQAYTYMKDLATKKQPIRLDDIRNLNRISTLETIEPKSEAGNYRTIDVYPYGTDKRPYASPFDIPDEMEKLQNWSDQARTKLHPVQYATDLHQKFVTIHPFRDGNGRTARLLMNLVLTENGYPVINVNPSKKARDNYMTALATAEAPENDPQPFRELIANYVEEELDSRIKTLQLNEKYTQEAKESFNRSGIDWKSLEKESKEKLSQAELAAQFETQKQRQKGLEQNGPELE